MQDENKKKKKKRSAPKLKCFTSPFENKNTVTVVNVSDKEIDPELVFNGATVDKIYYGNIDKLPPCEAAVFSIK